MTVAKKLACESQWVKWKMWKQSWDFRTFGIHKVKAMRHLRTLPTVPAISVGDVCRHFADLVIWLNVILELPVVRNYRSKLKQHFFLLFGIFFVGVLAARECLPTWFVFTLFGREITFFGPEIMPFQILVSTVMGGPSAPKRPKTKKTLGSGKNCKLPPKTIIYIKNQKYRINWKI